MCIEFKWSTLLQLRTHAEGRFLERERPSRELVSHDTRDARGLRHNLFLGDQGSLFVDENDIVWNKRADYFFQSESTAILGHLTMQSYSPRLLVSLHTAGMEQKKERLSFLTPPPLWTEFPGDFFAGFLQAPSLFDHKRLLIYGLYVYSFCKYKVISIEWSAYQARKEPAVSSLYVTA